MPSILHIARPTAETVHAFLNEKAHRYRGLLPAIIFTATFSSLLVFLSAYMIIWGVLYRLPSSPVMLVDRRVDKSQPPHYVAVCAALAANRHGFPGHAYVAWSHTLPINLERSDSSGFVPLRAADQIPSLWQPVPGVVMSNASYGNQRNFNALVVIVDQETYELSRAKSRAWKSDNFKVGSNDCVAYAASLATTIGLKTPATHYKFPQDYVKELKVLNRESAVPNSGKVFSMM